MSMNEGLSTKYTSCGSWQAALYNFCSGSRWLANGKRIVAQANGAACRHITAPVALGLQSLVGTVGHKSMSYRSRVWEQLTAVPMTSLARLSNRMDVNRRMLSVSIVVESIDVISDSHHFTLSIFVQLMASSIRRHHSWNRRRFLSGPSSRVMRHLVGWLRKLAAG